jgi:hypothetical protein
VARVVAVLVPNFLFFSFFKQLRSVNLKDFNFFLDVDYVFLYDLQSFSPLAFVFDLNLDEQVPFLRLCGQQYRLL